MVPTKELSTAEIEAISDLSATSAVKKEKVKLQAIMYGIDAVKSEQSSNAKYELTADGKKKRFSSIR